MLGVPLDKRVRRILGVSVGDDLALTLVDTPTTYFPAHVLAPQADNGQIDISPRSTRSPWRIYWDRVPAELGFGDRIEVPGDTTYELIATPRGVNNGRRVVGYSAPALPIEVLYPRSAGLFKLGAGAESDPEATIACNLYSQQDRQSARGDYHDSFAEAPAEAWPTLQPLLAADNPQLRFDGGDVWKVTDATLSFEQPYVSMTLRRS